MALNSFFPTGCLWVDLIWRLRNRYVRIEQMVCSNTRKNVSCSIVTYLLHNILVCNNRPYFYNSAILTYLSGYVTISISNNRTDHDFDLQINTFISHKENTLVIFIFQTYKMFMLSHSLLRCIGFTAKYFPSKKGSLKWVRVNKSHAKATST